MRTYRDAYRPFFDRCAMGLDRRHLVRALWAFGKVLKTGYGRGVFRAKYRSSTS